MWRGLYITFLTNEDNVELSLTHALAHTQATIFYFVIGMADSEPTVYAKL